MSPTTSPRTVTVCPASGVAAPLPCTASMVVVGGASQVAGGGGGAALGLTCPRVAGAGPCQTRLPPCSTRDSESPAGSLPDSATPMSVLVVPAAGPSAAVSVPS